MNPLIAFTGLAGSGKTTAAKLLCQRGYVRTSFAEPIRHMLHAFGLTPTDLGEGKMKPHAYLFGKTPREAMQTLGTEWGRQMIGPDIWIQATQRTIVEFWATRAADGILPGVVIDDCRFDNEAEMVRSLKGIIITIHRKGVVQQDHVSEKGISPKFVDEIIINDGTEEDLYSKIMEVTK